MDKISAIVLAAGKGTRMGSAEGSEIPKVMFKVNGRPMIEYSIQNLKNAGIDKIVLVVGYKKEMVMEDVGNKVSYAVQTEQLGTGHAVAMAKEKVLGKSKWVIVCFGDMPFYQPATIKALIAKVKAENPKMGMLTVHFKDPEFWAYGRIVRDEQGRIVKSVEQKDCTKEELKIKECMPSFYIYDNDWLWANIFKLGTKNAQKEYYLSDLIELAAKEGGLVSTEVANEWEALGINNLEQLGEGEKIMKKISALQN